MAYLAGSTHFNNWIFSAEEVALARRLGLLKAKRALRLERERQQAAASAGAAAVTARKARSFAALLPKSSTAERDANDLDDATDADVDREEEAEEKQGLQLTPLLEYLTPAQEALLRAFYEEKIQESCSQQFLRTSDKVKCCAVMLYKRFYLSNSVMEFHPKFIVPTAIYVAGKVEEQYMSVDTVADQLHVDHKHIIGHEMVLLEGVRFQLIMYHPFRALLGFMGDLQSFAKAVLAKELPAALLQKLHANSCAVLNELLLTDLPLTQYPAYLALAALAMVADELASDQPEASDSSSISKADVIEFIRRSKFSQGQDVDEVLKRLEVVEQVYRDDKLRCMVLAESKEAAEQRAKEVKLIYKKLKKFHEEDKPDKKKKKDKDGGDDKKRKSDKKDDKKKAKKHKKDKK
jgi:cyclin H